jgi:hypothetical protein
MKTRRSHGTRRSAETGTEKSAFGWPAAGNSSNASADQATQQSALDGTGGRIE